MTWPGPISPSPTNPGNIRVIARVRPVTKEDGEGPEATNAVTFDADDDSIIHLLHKGKPVSFELDKVFSPQASQQDVSVAPCGKGKAMERGKDGLTGRERGWAGRSLRVGGTGIRSGEPGSRTFLWRTEEGGKLRLKALEASFGRRDPETAHPLPWLWFLPSPRPLLPCGPAHP